MCASMAFSEPASRPTSVAGVYHLDAAREVAGRNGCGSFLHSGQGPEGAGHRQLCDDDGGNRRRDADQECAHRNLVEGVFTSL